MATTSLSITGIDHRIKSLFEGTDRKLTMFENLSANVMMTVAKNKVTFRAFLDNDDCNFVIVTNKDGINSICVNVDLEILPGQDEKAEEVLRTLRYFLNQVENGKIK